MPYDCWFYPQHRLGVAIFYDRIDGTDLEEAMRSLYLAPSWEPFFSGVWNFCAVTELVLLPSGIDRLMTLFEGLGPQLSEVGRTAVLTCRELDELITRLILQLREEHVGRSSEIFYSAAPHARGPHDSAIEQAADWLGVPAACLTRKPEPQDPSPSQRATV